MKTKVSSSFWRYDLGVFLAFKIAKNGKINFQNQALDGT